MNDDELRARLQAADPTQRDAPADSWIDELVEATMNDQETGQKVGKRPPRNRLRAAGAAAAVAIIAVGGYAFVAADDGGGNGKKDEAQTVLVLTAPDGTSMMSCIQFSVDVLRGMQSAFDGTAIAVDGDQVTLDVNRWYKGGDADRVEIKSRSDIPVSLEGEIDFTEGERYLVTATDGAMNICGYSAVWTQDMADAFEAAFAG